MSRNVLHHPLLPLPQHLLLLLLIGRRLGQTDLQLRPGQVLPVEVLHGLDGPLPHVEVHEGVVLDLLDPLDAAVAVGDGAFEGLSDLILGDGGDEVPHVEHFDLGHDGLVGLLLRVGPIDDDITAPDFDAARFQPALGQRGGLVRFVFEEAEAAVLLLVIRRTVDDHLAKSG